MVFLEIYLHIKNKSVIRTVVEKIENKLKEKPAIFEPEDEGQLNVKEMIERNEAQKKDTNLEGIV